MKKTFALLLTLLLALSVLSMVSAAAPTLTAEDVSAAPGEEFEISLRIQNNPGFSYLKITFTYDDALMLLDVINGGVSTDAFSVTPKAVSWDTNGDATADGTLAVFRFKAAAAGKTAVTFKVAGCYNYNEEAVSLPNLSVGVAIIAPHVHTFGDWKPYDATRHFRVCKDDPTHVEYGEHVWDMGVISSEPRCVSAGVRTYACAVCGGTRTETLSATGHDWSDWTVTKPATATADGEEARTCSRCGKTETRVLPKTGEQPEPPDPVRAPGDVDLDGEVTAADARLALRRAVELDDHLTAVQLRNADVDGQPGVTAADARLILRAAVGLEDPKNWLTE